MPVLSLCVRAQHYILLKEAEKNHKLNGLFDAFDFNQVVILVRSVHRAAELNKLLEECHFPSLCIHSGIAQEERFVKPFFGPIMLREKERWWDGSQWAHGVLPISLFL